MGITLDTKSSTVNNNRIDIELLVRHISDSLGGCNHVLSREYTINGVTTFQLMLNETKQNKLLYFVKFTKKRPNDELNYSLQYTDKLDSSDKILVRKNFNTDDGTWHLIREIAGPNYRLNVSIQVVVAATINPCASLHEDIDLTDFQLRGVDGSVHIHKAIVAAYSPVLRAMFTGSWREITEGVVDIPDTTQLTLQHLKNYMYLGQVPDTGLERLLLLATCYMMPDLERQCVHKLLATVTTATAYDMIEFAVKESMTRLLFEILRRVQSGELPVQEMERSVLTTYDLQ